MHAGLHIRQACAVERPPRVAALHVPIRRSHGTGGVFQVAHIWALAGLWRHTFDFIAKLEWGCEILTTGRCRS